MIETTRTWVRKSINTPWWTVAQTNGCLEYIKTKYKDTGKIVTTNLSIDKTGLILTNVAKFSSAAVFEEYSSDPIIRAWVSTRKNYCIKYKIDEAEVIVFNDE